MPALRHAQTRPADPASRFIIGRDGHGGWIVQDRRGLVGGLFATEAAASHFAVQESDHNPTDVCRASDDVVLEFHCSATASPGAGRPPLRLVGRPTIP